MTLEDGLSGFKFQDVALKVYWIHCVVNEWRLNWIVTEAWSIFELSLVLQCIIER